MEEIPSRRAGEPLWRRLLLEVEYIAATDIIIASVLAPRYQQSTNKLQDTMEDNKVVMGGFTILVVGKSCCLEGGFDCYWACFATA